MLTTLLCTVIAVSAGDMLTVRCTDKQERVVRVSAIDAPERSQPWGEQSRRALADLCFRQEVKLTPRAVDKQKRTIGDVECRGQDAGQYQIRSGMAWVYDRHARQYGGLYLIEYEARNHRQGLWADKTPVAPWDWRYRQTRVSETVAGDTRHR